MKLFKISKFQNFSSLFKNQLFHNKKFSTGGATKTKKSFLLNKPENKTNKEIKVSPVSPITSNKSDSFPKRVSSIHKKEQLMQLNMGKEGIQSVKGLHNLSEKNKEIDKDKVKIKENYACVYYKLPIDQEFDLFKLRNLLYSYIFGEISEKNKKVQETLKILDWLDISLDFNDKFKNSIFETQRNDNYNKWLKYLIGQKDAYKCFCKSYKKCEKHCSDSRENIDSEDFKDNKDVMYIRFKNQNRNYKYYDYMSYEDIEFDSSSMGDFLLYKNFNGLFLDSFKRVIDDDMYSVTHIIEEKKNFNPMKNVILTKHLMFGEKKYIELPNIKIKHWPKEDFEKIEIDYLRKRGLVPEAIVNEALMLGYTKNPAKEFKELLSKNQDKDVADWNRVIWQFDITNIYESGSVFDIRRLLYLNKRNMVKKFIKSHESYKPQIFEEFKQTFLQVYKKHENKIATWDYEYWRKIIYLITPNIISYEDLYTYYFLFEPPIVSAITKENKKAIKAFILDEDYKKHILKEVLQLFAGMQKFDAKSINREISYFIFKRYQKDRNIQNINFYPFLKLIVTGFADVPNIGEICEVIGKNEIIKRVKSASKISKTSAVDNIKLIQEKKQQSLLVLANFEPKLITDK